MDVDIFVQIAVLVFTLCIFYLLHTLPKRALSSFRSKTRPNNQANRHFIQGAEFLSRARCSKSKSTTISLAKSAVNEADKALAIQPRDPAAHILKAMAQTVTGQKTAALKSLDSALSPPAAKMLSGPDRGEALYRRAELQIELNRKRRIESAIEDLLEAVKLRENNGKAFRLLGECYEMKGLKEEAQNAFNQALRIEPNLTEARDGLARIGF